MKQGVSIVKDHRGQVKQRPLTRALGLSHKQHITVVLLKMLWQNGDRKENRGDGGGVGGRSGAEAEQGQRRRRDSP